MLLVCLRATEIQLYYTAHAQYEYQIAGGICHNIYNHHRKFFRNEY